MDLNSILGGLMMSSIDLELCVFVFAASYTTEKNLHEGWKNSKKAVSAMKELRLEQQNNINALFTEFFTTK